MSEESGVSGSNPCVNLSDVFTGSIEQFGTWVKQNSAILVVHGVGNQNTLETLDAFGRGVIDAYVAYGGVKPGDLSLSHHLAKRVGDEGGIWFDNFIRIEHRGHSAYIDLYEYFWAHYPEGKVSLPDMQNFVEATAAGAKDFYAEQAKLGLICGDRSVFFEDGKFLAHRYKAAIKVAVLLIPTLVKIAEVSLHLLRRIPLIGPLAYKWGEKLEQHALYLLTNVAGDVVAYNTTDPKQKLYQVRRKVLTGAVSALRFLLEPSGDGPKYKEDDWQYAKVLLAGHSLGTQVVFDALNRFDHLLGQGEIRGADKAGNLLINGKPSNTKVADLVSGLVTFGSPLDKVAFFFRERCKPENWLRRQMIEHFHCFKQKDWSLTQDAPPFVVASTLPRLFEDVMWRNYFDPHDAVSGSLDFYKGLTNVNCRFVPESASKVPAPLSYFIPFTHSRYWGCREMYGDIINQVLHR